MIYFLPLYSFSRADVNHAQTNQCDFFCAKSFLDIAFPARYNAAEKIAKGDRKMAGKINGIHHTCLQVEDFEKSLDFYTKVLEYRVEATWPGAALLRASDGARLELFREGTVGPENGYRHIAMKTDDVDAAFRAAVEYGCEPATEPKDAELPATPVKKIRIAFVKDPCGNLIEFFCEK